MSNSAFTSIIVEKTMEKTGLLGRRSVTDELLRMQLPQGSVCLRRSAVIAAGDNYFRLKNDLKEAAARKGIPWQETD